MERWSTLAITFDGEQDLRHPDSRVLWVDERGETYATGTVTDFEPEKRLRVSPQFSVWVDRVAPEDIASEFVLEEQDGATYLRFTYGDFSKVPDGESLWEMYLDSITPENRELRKIRELAEE